jgi:hypothetical protein
MGEPGPDEYEAALRQIPEMHSLALRLTSAGVADDVVCEYLRIAPEGLETLLRVARAKLAAELRSEEGGNVHDGL